MSDATPLINKSKKLQSKRSVTDRIEKVTEEDLAREKFNNLELEYEQNLVSTDRVYMVRVFPVFILFLGLFLIFIHMLLHKTYLTLYIGIIVTLAGIIWKIIMVKVEKKRKEELFNK